MPVQAIFWMEQEKVCAGAVVQGRQVRAGSKGKRIGRLWNKSISSNSVYKRKSGSCIIFLDALNSVVNIV